MTDRTAIVCNGVVPGSRLPSGAQGLRAYGLHAGLAAFGRESDIVTRESTVQAQLDRWAAASMRFPEYWRVLPDKALPARLQQDYSRIIFINWVGIDAFEKPEGVEVIYDFFSPSMVEHSFISSGPRLEHKRVKKDGLLAQADRLIANGTGRAEYGRDYLRTLDTDHPLPPPVSVRLAMPWRAASPPADGPLRVFFGGFDQAWTRGLGTGTLERIATLPGVGVSAIGVGEHLHFWDRRNGRANPFADKRVDWHQVSRLEDYRAVNGGCHVSLDVFERNRERELCYSTRAVTSLASGCPVITMAFTEVGRLVAETGAGWTLEEFSVPALLDLVRHLAAHRDEVSERARNTRLFWERYCDPEHEIRPLIEALQ